MQCARDWFAMRKASEKGKRIRWLFNTKSTYAVTHVYDTLKWDTVDTRQVIEPYHIVFQTDGHIERVNGNENDQSFGVFEVVTEYGALKVCICESTYEIIPDYSGIYSCEMYNGDDFSFETIVVHGQLAYRLLKEN